MSFLTCGTPATSEVQKASYNFYLDMEKKLLRCACGSAFDFTNIYKCAGCAKPLCFDCAKTFRGKRYCKPCRKTRADAASRGEL